VHSTSPKITSIRIDSIRELGLLLSVDLNDEKWGRGQSDVLTPALVRDFWSLQSANVLSSWKSRPTFLVG